MDKRLKDKPQQKGFICTLNLFRTNLLHFYAKSSNSHLLTPAYLNLNQTSFQKGTKRAHNTVKCLDSTRSTVDSSTTNADEDTEISAEKTGKRTKQRKLGKADITCPYNAPAHYHATNPKTQSYTPLQTQLFRITDSPCAVKIIV